MPARPLGVSRRGAEWGGWLALILVAGGQGSPLGAQTFECTTPRWTLVYSGGPSRPRYPVRDLVAYVAVVDTQGTPQAWLSTGTIFLEYQAASGRSLTWARNPPFALGQDWTDHLDSLFAPGGVIARLDSAVELTSQTLGARISPYEVALMLPYPDPRMVRSRFGEHWLEFGDRAGRLAGVEAYLAEARARFAAGGFLHLKLRGFYWLNEGIFPADLGFTPLVAARIHDAGLRFLWIPDFYDFTQKHWQRVEELGFDQVFVQPNYFIDPSTTSARIDSAVAAARSQRAGVALEFDVRLFSSPQFRERLAPTLAALRAAPDLLGGPLALYEGGGALPRLARASEPGLRAQYEDLVRTFRVPEESDACL